MEKGEKMKQSVQKGILTVFVIAWMIMVFLFSNQDATDSTNTSDIFVSTITKTFGIVEEEQIETIRFIVRKLAHFSLYTLGGILIYILFNTFTR